MRKHNKKSRRPRRQNARKTRRMRMRRGGVVPGFLSGLLGKTQQPSTAVSQPTTTRDEPDYSEEKLEVMAFLDDKNDPQVASEYRYSLIDQIVNKLKQTPEFDKYETLLKKKIDGFTKNPDKSIQQQSILSIILFYMTANNITSKIPPKKPEDYIPYMLTYITSRIQQQPQITISSIQGLIWPGLTSFKKGIPPN